MAIAHALQSLSRQALDANGPDDVFVTFVGGRIKRWSSIAASDEEFARQQEAPAAYPTLRTHRIGVGLDRRGRIGVGHEGAILPPLR